MKKLNVTLALACAGGLSTAIAGNAAAYTPKWLECTGNQVVTHTVNGKTENSTTPSHEYYVYDDDGKNIYKYNETTKLTVVEPIRSYDDKKIEWSIPEKMGHADPFWDAEIDRGSLAFKQVLHDPGAGETTTWTAQCKATNPIPDAK